MLGDIVRWPLANPNHSDAKSIPAPNAFDVEINERAYRLRSPKYVQRLLVWVNCLKLSLQQIFRSISSGIWIIEFELLTNLRDSLTTAWVERSHRWMVIRMVS